MSSSHRRGQSAVEVLFILAIILVGSLIVMPSYLDQNRAASLVTYVRVATSEACSYLNTGVVSNETIYSPLNAIINTTNYTYRGFQLVGIVMGEKNGTLQVNVTVTYSGASLDSGEVSNALKSYIENYLVERTNAVRRDGKLYLEGREVEINVGVVRR